MLTRPLALLVAITLALVSACRSSSSSQQAITPLLWSVEKDGTTSYVMGTMHAGVASERLPPVVWERLASSRAFAMETDLSGAAALPVLRTDGTSLRDELGDAYWDKLEDALGIDEAARLVGFKPVVPAMLVAMRGLPPTQAIDGALHARATSLGKELVYLEPLPQQFAIIEKWLDLRALKDLLDDLPAVEATSKQMLAAYVAGDAAQVTAVTDQERTRWVARGRSPADFDAQMEDLLYRRNAAWIPQIEALHARGGAFVAVGAAHTVGPRSVVQLLTERGYKVTRIAGPRM